MKKILVIDDDIAVKTSLALLFKRNGFRALGADGPEMAHKILVRESPDLVVMDMNFTVDTSGKQGLQLLGEIRKDYPIMPIILITGWGSVALAVEGMKAGAKDFITKPWDNNAILQSVNTILSIGEENAPAPIAQNRGKLDKDHNFGHIIGKDPKLLEILETIARVGQTDASVLIMGESGTGKELIAEAVHLNSRRTDKPFVKVNLGGISSSLFESELFGHKKGAFTDAHTDRVGRFDLANTGSIFLDEIGDLDLNCQVKLLRVLQDKTFEVLGSSQTKKADVRVISATNRNLEEMVGENTFREDLFYRINLITVKLPALRERPSDIPLLVNYFINNLKEIYNRPNLMVNKEALKWLKKQPLYGNIRELKNIVERSVLVSPHDELTIEDFERFMNKPSSKKQKNNLPDVGTMSLEEMEKEMIVKAMEFHQGKITKVARSLGITRNALYRRLEKYEIEN